MDKDEISNQASNANEARNVDNVSEPIILVNEESDSDISKRSRTQGLCSTSSTVEKPDVSNPTEKGRSKNCSKIAPVDSQSSVSTCIKRTVSQCHSSSARTAGSDIIKKNKTRKQCFHTNLSSQVSHDISNSTKKDTSKIYSKMCSGRSSSCIKCPGHHSVRTTTEHHATGLNQNETQEASIINVCGQNETLKQQEKPPVFLDVPNSSERSLKVVLQDIRTTNLLQTVPRVSAGSVTPSQSESSVRQKRRRSQVPDIYADNALQYPFLPGKHQRSQGFEICENIDSNLSVGKDNDQNQKSRITELYVDFYKLNLCESSHSSEEGSDPPELLKASDYKSGVSDHTRGSTDSISEPPTLQKVELRNDLFHSTNDTPTGVQDRELDLPVLQTADPTFKKPAIEMTFPHIVLQHSEGNTEHGRVENFEKLKEVIGNQEEPSSDPLLVIAPTPEQFASNPQLESHNFENMNINSSKFPAGFFTHSAQDENDSTIETDEVLQPSQYDIPSFHFDVFPDSTSESTTAENDKQSLFTTEDPLFTIQPNINQDEFTTENERLSVDITEPLRLNPSTLPAVEEHVRKSEDEADSNWTLNQYKQERSSVSSVEDCQCGVFPEADVFASVSVIRNSQESLQDSRVDRNGDHSIGKSTLKDETIPAASFSVSETSEKRFQRCLPTTMEDTQQVRDFFDIRILRNPFWKHKRSKRLSKKLKSEERPSKVTSNSSGSTLSCPSRSKRHLEVSLQLHTSSHLVMRPSQLSNAIQEQRKNLRLPPFQSSFPRSLQFSQVSRTSEQATLQLTQGEGRTHIQHVKEGSGSNDIALQEIGSTSSKVNTLNLRFTVGSSSNPTSSRPTNSSRFLSKKICVVRSKKICAKRLKKFKLFQLQFISAFPSKKQCTARYQKFCFASLKQLFPEFFQTRHPTSQEDDDDAINLPTTDTDSLTLKNTAEISAPKASANTPTTTSSTSLITITSSASVPANTTTHYASSNTIAVCVSTTIATSVLATATSSLTNTTAARSIATTTATSSLTTTTATSIPTTTASSVLSTTSTAREFTSITGNSVLTIKSTTCKFIRITADSVPTIASVVSAPTRASVVSSPTRASVVSAPTRASVVSVPTILSVVSVPTIASAANVPETTTSTIISSETSLSTITIAHRISATTTEATTTSSVPLTTPALRSFSTTTLASVSMTRPATSAQTATATSTSTITTVANVPTTTVASVPMTTYVTRAITTSKTSLPIATSASVPIETSASVPTTILTTVPTSTLTSVLTTTFSCVPIVTSASVPTTTTVPITTQAALQITASSAPTTTTADSVLKLTTATNVLKLTTAANVTTTASAVNVATISATANVTTTSATAKVTTTSATAKVSTTTTSSAADVSTTSTSANATATTTAANVTTATTAISVLKSITAANVNMMTTAVRVRATTARTTAPLTTSTFAHTTTSISAPITTSTTGPITTSTSVPVTACCVPVTKCSVPVSTCSVPVTTSTSAPIITTSTSATTTIIPVTTTSTSATTTIIPVTTTSTSATTTIIPVTTTSTSATTILPVTTYSVHVTTSTSATTTSVPLTTCSVPVTTSTSAPITTTSVPVRTCSVSVTTSTSAPITTSTSAPVTTSTSELITTSTSELITTSTSALATTSTIAPITTSTSGTSVPATICSVPVTPSTNAPVAITSTPITTSTSVPITTSTSAPVTTTSTSAPIITTSTSATTIIPVTTCSVHVTTLTSVPITTSASAITTSVPVITFNVPVAASTSATTSSVPLTTCSAPVTTSTSAPVTTSTSAPVTTSTSAPVTTSTSAPVTTSTSAPITTTSVPVTTSTSEPITTSTSALATTSTSAPIITYTSETTVSVPITSCSVPVTTSTSVPATTCSVPVTTSTNTPVAITSAPVTTTTCATTTSVPITTSTVVLTSASIITTASIPANLAEACLLKTTSKVRKLMNAASVPVTSSAKVPTTTASSLPITTVSSIPITTTLSTLVTTASIIKMTTAKAASVRVNLTEACLRATASKLLTPSNAASLHTTTAFEVSTTTENAAASFSSASPMRAGSKPTTSANSIHTTIAASVPTAVTDTLRPTRHKKFGSANLKELFPNLYKTRYFSSRKDNAIPTTDKKIYFSKSSTRISTLKTSASVPVSRTSAKVLTTAATTPTATAAKTATATAALGPTLMTEARLSTTASKTNTTATTVSATKFEDFSSFEEMPSTSTAKTPTTAARVPRTTKITVTAAKPYVTIAAAIARTPTRLSTTTDLAILSPINSARLSATSNSARLSSANSARSSTTNLARSSSANSVRSSTTNSARSTTTNSARSSTTNSVRLSTTTNKVSTTTIDKVLARSKLAAATAVKLPATTYTKLSIITAAKVPTTTASKVPRTTAIKVPTITATRAPTTTPTIVPTTTAARIPGIVNFKNISRKYPVVVQLSKYSSGSSSKDSGKFQKDMPSSKRTRDVDKSLHIQKILSLSKHSGKCSPKTDSCALAQKSPKRDSSALTQKSPKRDSSSLAQKSPKRDSSALAQKSPKRDSSALAQKSPKRDFSALAQKSPKRDSSALAQKSPKRDSSSLAQKSPKRDVSALAQKSPKRDSSALAQKSPKRDSSALAQKSPKMRRSRKGIPRKLLPNGRDKNLNLENGLSCEIGMTSSIALQQPDVIPLNNTPSEVSSSFPQPKIKSSSQESATASTILETETSDLVAQDDLDSSSDEFLSTGSIAERVKLRYSRKERREALARIRGPLRRPDPTDRGTIQNAPGPKPGPKKRIPPKKIKQKGDNGNCSDPTDRTTIQNSPGRGKKKPGPKKKIPPKKIKQKGGKEKVLEKNNEPKIAAKPANSEPKKVEPIYIIKGDEAANQNLMFVSNKRKLSPQQTPKKKLCAKRINDMQTPSTSQQVDSDSFWIQDDDFLTLSPDISPHIPSEVVEVEHSNLNTPHESTNECSERTSNKVDFITDRSASPSILHLAFASKTPDPKIKDHGKKEKIKKPKPLSLSSNKNNGITKRKSSEKKKKTVDLSESSLQQIINSVTSIIERSPPVASAPSATTPNPVLHLTPRLLRSSNNIVESPCFLAKARNTSYKLNLQSVNTDQSCSTDPQQFMLKLVKVPTEEITEVIENTTTVLDVPGTLVDPPEPLFQNMNQFADMPPRLARELKKYLIVKMKQASIAKSRAALRNVSQATIAEDMDSSPTNCQPIADTFSSNIIPSSMDEVTDGGLSLPTPRSDVLLGNQSTDKLSGDTSEATFSMDEVYDGEESPATPTSDALFGNQLMVNVTDDTSDLTARYLQEQKEDGSSQYTIETIEVTEDDDGISRPVRAAVRLSEKLPEVLHDRFHLENGPLLVVANEKSCDGAQEEIANGSNVKQNHETQNQRNINAVESYALEKHFLDFMTLYASDINNSRSSTPENSGNASSTSRSKCTSPTTTLNQKSIPTNPSKESFETPVSTSSSSTSQGTVTTKMTSPIRRMMNPIPTNLLQRLESIDETSNFSIEETSPDGASPVQHRISCDDQQMPSDSSVNTDSVSVVHNDSNPVENRIFKTSPNSKSIDSGARNMRNIPNMRRNQPETISTSTSTGTTIAMFKDPNSPEKKVQYGVPNLAGHHRGLGDDDTSGILLSGSESASTQPVHNLSTPPSRRRVMRRRVSNSRFNPIRWRPRPTCFTNQTTGQIQTAYPPRNNYASTIDTDDQNANTLIKAKDLRNQSTRTSIDDRDLEEERLNVPVQTVDDRSYLHSAHVEFIEANSRYVPESQVATGNNYLLVPNPPPQNVGYQVIQNSPSMGVHLRHPPPSYQTILLNAFHDNRPVTYSVVAGNNASYSVPSVCQNTITQHRRIVNSHPNVHSGGLLRVPHPCPHAAPLLIAHDTSYLSQSNPHSNVSYLGQTIRPRQLSDSTVPHLLHCPFSYFGHLPPNC